jgi:hypothetical protein
MVERSSYPCLIECLFIEDNEGSDIGITSNTL